jgi:hypothetical protein
MAIEPRSDNITLSDIKCRQVIICDPTDEDINSRLGKLGSLLDLRPFLTWKRDAEAGSIHPVNNAQTLGIAVRHENANCVRIGHDFHLLAGEFCLKLRAEEIP